jgi:hypothetical protein
VVTRSCFDRSIDNAGAVAKKVPFTVKITNRADSRFVHVFLRNRCQALCSTSLLWAMSSALSAKPSLEENIPTNSPLHRCSRHVAAVFQQRDGLSEKTLRESTSVRKVSYSVSTPLRAVLLSPLSKASDNTGCS